jgi:hypothetical protein
MDKKEPRDVAITFLKALLETLKSAKPSEVCNAKITVKTPKEFVGQENMPPEYYREGPKTVIVEVVLEPSVQVVGPA